MMQFPSQKKGEGEKSQLIGCLVMANDTNNRNCPRNTKCAIFFICLGKRVRRYENSMFWGKYSKNCNDNIY